MEKELAGLKDFQRRTVDHVHERLFGADPVRRFLVADEVGLGKTLVARGVVAKTIDTLWDSVDRIDVVYICSNNQIAGQNLKKLRVGATDDTQHADRLTMLPKVISRLEGQKLNFVSFTPGTSFNLKGSGGGRAGERVLLYWMLRDGLQDSSMRANRWIRFFQGGSAFDSFSDQLAWFDAYDRSSLNEEMTAEFADMVRRERYGEESLVDALTSCADEFNYLRKGTKVPDEVSARRYRLIGRLRHLVATASVARLEPDLVILDEFQRFKNLMSEEDETAELAHALWNHADAKLLLLSATPFKMYTLPDDPEGEDHYEDFRDTVRFLAGAERADRVTRHSAAMRSALFSGDVTAARAARDGVQEELRRVMVRTERLAATPDRDGMIRNETLPGVELAERDVRAYISDTAVGDVLNTSDVLEYWRSAPYLFELMDSYQVKKRLATAAESPNQALTAALTAGGPRLSWDGLRTYEPLDPGNAKMRGLVADVLGREAWRLAWIPPSLPYVRLAGPYAEPALRDFTKRLVFSSWTVVPKAIGSVVSYEAERRLTNTTPTAARAYDAARPTALLTFQKSEGRLTGMPVLGLLYPSAALAEAGDPLEIARGGAHTLPLDRGSYVGAVRERVERLLEDLPPGSETGVDDDSWYWAAPRLLDQRRVQRPVDEDLRWGRSYDTEAADNETRFNEHLDSFLDVDVRDLGRRPDDLVDVLTLLAVGGLGVLALRALVTAVRLGGHVDDSAVRSAASDMAWSLRGLFNKPEIMAAVRYDGGRDLPYWQVVMQHALDGGLQSVLDEYLHVLLESEGLTDKPLDEQLDRLTEVVDAALALRASTSSVHFFTTDGERVKIDKDHGLRSHFAVRFGRGTAEDSAAVQRENAVRASYNSPFWPFVLASTSVGQEGLDFHQYSHAIVHWNLPGNPVDLEQREGRVHRYKGHAVRKNAADRYGGRSEVSESLDPWRTMFELAAADRPEGESEIYPFWVLPGKYAIERYAPVMPLSRETHALSRLMRTLGAYRLVMGQPRQEELLSYLGDRVDQLADLGIDLSPPETVAPSTHSGVPIDFRTRPSEPAKRLAREVPVAFRSAPASRILDVVRANPWSLASDVAAEVGLSTGTVRGYLHRMRKAGLLETREDPSIRNPHGGGAFRFCVRTDDIASANPGS
ncbi:helicase-related protein [Phycicoccus sp. DTK01]|uniref:helicase-related protein n=1 Tax=Phycicoccus sp. DTK01 TaxID=2785745 RepID=UPI001A8DF0A3|nr:helicase-related protein [Phycicoccus sp. DTK01]